MVRLQGEGQESEIPGWQLFDEVPANRSSLFRVACFTPSVFAFVCFDSERPIVSDFFLYPRGGSALSEPLEDFAGSFDFGQSVVGGFPPAFPKSVPKFGFECRAYRGVRWKNLGLIV